MSLLLGVDYGGTKVDVGVGTDDGTIVASRRLRVEEFSSLNDLIARSLEVGRAMAGSEPITAVGVSTMGITSEDSVALAPNIPGWADLHLPSLMRGAFPGLPVVIENDVRAACYAEVVWGSLKSIASAAYLNLGTGIAMALVINGRVYSGAHGAAGEIAYVWRAGEAGFSEGHAPFEEQYGGGGLDRLVRERFTSSANVEEIFRRRDDPEVRDWIHEVFQEVARRVGHVLLACDVEQVAVGGGIAQQFDWLSPIFEEEWKAHLPFPPKLVRSRFLAQAGLHGALALAARGGMVS